MKNNRKIVLALYLFIAVSACVSNRKNDKGFGGAWKGNVERPEYAKGNSTGITKIQSPSAAEVQSDKFTMGAPSESQTKSLSKTGELRKFETNAVENSNKENVNRIGNKEVLPISAANENSSKESQKDADLWIYLLSAGMLGGIFAFLKRGRKTTNKISRFAKKNPIKTQFMIAGMQFLLAGTGVLAGYNLHEMGYDISIENATVFSIATIAGFLSVPFLAKNNATILPRVLNRRRLGYLGISISSLMIMATYGNNILKMNVPDYVKETVIAADHEIVHATTAAFSDGDQNNPESMKQARKIDSGGALAIAILVTFLLTMTVCAGICLIIFGIDGDPVLIPIGLAILGLSIWGLVAIWKWAMAKNKPITK